ncbi:MAG: divergent polysaccharide deacetylase family protein, partial [Candidatus Cloacimonetes bacterium]|nr:divergent polysaccharide deacetylase family protein [Candidatus Cloacimonadota bacterium]
MLKKKKYTNNYSWIFVIIVFAIIAIPITCTKVSKQKDLPEYSEVEELPAEQLPPQEEIPPNENYGSKRIAIVIDDFGEADNSLVGEFNELPTEVAFAIIPDLPKSKQVMALAMLKNRDVLIHMPMEPEDYPKNNPGKNAIYTNLSDDEIKARVEHFCQELPNAVGINNHMGSKATSDKRTMDAVCSVLKEHDMFFIDSFTIASSVVGKAASDAGVPSYRRHIFLDVPDSSLENAKLKIAELNKKNPKNNPTVIITHCLNKNKLLQLQEFIRLAQA